MDPKNPVARLKKRRKILNHLTTDFRIHLLGPPEILVGERIPKGRLLDRPLAIFVYLAVSGGMIGRSHLTKIFWPGLGEREASTALSRALYTLETRGLGPLLEKRSGSLRFLPPRGVRSSFDIESFTNEAPPPTAAISTSRTSARNVRSICGPVSPFTGGHSSKVSRSLPIRPPSKAGSPKGASSTRGLPIASGRSFRRGPGMNAPRRERHLLSLQKPGARPSQRGMSGRSWSWRLFTHWTAS